MLKRIPSLIFLASFSPSMALLVGGLGSVPGQQTPRPTNRLIHEKSPYLQEHAHNPVNWFPWGEEAFKLAQEQGRPIFLSIGYSTCHWCHVMERESFSDPQIAAFLNEHFVSIKVDREERPDLDRVYMAFVQASTGRGGWPMTVFLTPDRKPFFGGTYYPPQSRPGLVGFVPLLEKVQEQWSKNRDSIESSADRITQFLREQQNSGERAASWNETLFHTSLKAFQSTFDETYGGFGSAPKFPRASTFVFLSSYAWSYGSSSALKMLSKTLKAMAKGGIHDHVGGGFHRYSTDARWFLPHFEKMLYDQAQIAQAYLTAYQLSGDSSFARVAERIFEYVLRDMQDPAGGFYTAEDADSLPPGSSTGEKSEGAFYVWSDSELRRLLDTDHSRFAGQFGVRPEGNVEKDQFGEFRNLNILHRSSENPDLIQGPAEQWLEKLMKARRARPRPLRDEKILTAWNGLMISALARGYQVLREPDLLRAAQRAAQFIMNNLYDRQSHRLRRHHRNGASEVPGFLDDYVFLAAGLLDLYESDLDSRWLLFAFELTDASIDVFWDPNDGEFFNNSGKDSSVLVRLKEGYDGAEPAPGSVAASNMARLSQLAPDRYRARLDRLQAIAAGRISKNPTIQPRMLAAMLQDRFKPVQILIAGDRSSLDTKLLLKTILEEAPPHRLIFLADRGPAHTKLATNLDILASIKPLEGKATAYICENYVCKLPTSDQAQVSRQLRELSESQLAKLR